MARILKHFYFVTANRQNTITLMTNHTLIITRIKYGRPAVLDNNAVTKIYVQLEMFIPLEMF